MSKRDFVLTDDQTCHLLRGWCLTTTDGAAPDFPFKNEEHRQQCWEQHSKTLIDKATGFGGELWQREPFSRPDAWWDYEAPEPRRIVCGAEVWEMVEAPYNRRHYKRGMMAVVKLRNPELGGSPYYSIDAPKLEYESEKDYLIRLGLLLPHEKELLNNQC